MVWLLINKIIFHVPSAIICIHDIVVVDMLWLFFYLLFFGCLWTYCGCHRYFMAIYGCAVTICEHKLSGFGNAIVVFGHGLAVC